MVTDGASVDYDLHGPDGAPVVLMINGLGFGRWGFFKQVPALSRRLRVLTFDARGGGNPSQDGDFITELSVAAVALLDHLGIRKAHVLGTSLGGFVAQRLALDRPDMVERLVLVCTSAGGRGPEQVSPNDLAAMFGVGALTAEGAARRGLEVATSEAYRAEKPGEFEQIVRWRLADSPSLPVYHRQAMSGARFDATQEVGDISAPALVIHGREDRFIPLANAEALAKTLPDARLRVVEGAGHLVFIEQPTKVNRSIANFLGAGAQQANAEVAREGLRHGLGMPIARAVRGIAGRLLGSK